MHENYIGIVLFRNNGIWPHLKKKQNIASTKLHEKKIRNILFQ